MRRDPSIHIRESLLVSILEKHLGKKAGKFAPSILRDARMNSCNQRSITITNDKLDKKAKQILSSSKGDALLLSDILYNIRKKKKHRGITKINQEHREWSQVKKLTQIVIQFCNEFELDKRKGFIDYLTLGLSKINSSRQMISKLINMQESISNEYEFVKIIEDDENKKETLDIHDFYVSQIVKMTGMPVSFKENPQKYANLITVGKLTTELDIPYDIYIKAQFDGLDWTGNYPEPSQLVGDNARQRLNKYLYKNKLSVKKKETSTDNNYVDFLKNLKNKK